MFLWQWLVWEWLLITSLWLALLKWWSMHQAKSMSMPSRLYRNFVHTKVWTSKFEVPTANQGQYIVKNFERQKGNFCQLSNSDSLQCSYSSHVLKTFTNQFVQFKRARESGLECTTKIFESHDAQVTYRYELIQHFLNFFHLLPSVFYSSHVSFDFPFRIIRNIMC